MKTLTYAICIVAMALLAGCNKADSNAAVATTKAAPAASQASTTTAAATESDYQALAGTMLNMPGGEEVEVISVGKFDSDLQSLGGVIALEGRVAEVFADKGSLVLVDTDRMADCQDGCCPQAQVPVRLALENYEGEMPQAETEVIIVGDLTITSMGYEFSVLEIRQDAKVLIHETTETTETEETV